MPGTYPALLGPEKKSPEKIQQGVAARKKEKKTLNNK